MENLNCQILQICRWLFLCEVWPLGNKCNLNWNYSDCKYASPRCLLFSYVDMNYIPLLMYFIICKWCRLWWFTFKHSLQCLKKCFWLFFFPFRCRAALCAEGEHWQFDLLQLLDTFLSEWKPMAWLHQWISCHIRFDFSIFLFVLSFPFFHFLTLKNFCWNVLHNRVSTLWRRILRKEKWLND